MPLDYVRAKAGETWRMLITGGTRVDGHSLREGEVVELPVYQAVELMAAQKAVRAPEEPVAAVEPDTVPPAPPDPEPVTVAPEPAPPARAKGGKKIARS